MKLSGRNMLKGTIVDVKKGQTIAHARIDVGGFDAVQSAQGAIGQRLMPL
jgi:molybdopterin-binding protein